MKYRHIHLFFGSKNQRGDVMVVMKNRDCIDRRCLKREKGLSEFFLNIYIRKQLQSHLEKTSICPYMSVFHLVFKNYLQLVSHKTHHLE